MTDNPSESNTKIIVVYRVEPGCLGPDGERLVADFCTAANAAFRSEFSQFAHFLILPRRDTSLPEIQYRALEKNLPRDKAAVLLGRFDTDIDDFEEQIADRIAMLIEKFFNRDHGGH